MNLYLTAIDPEVPLAPSEWTMTIGSDNEGGTAHFFADLKRNGAQVCRLGLSGVVTEQEAHRRLAVKARVWIDDYLSRPHSGTTEFGALT